MDSAIMAEDTVKAISVVIVDDSDMVRQRLRAILNPRQGVEVVGEASDIERGAELIAERKPAVVILDIMMPGGSGLELLEEIKKEKESPAVIVLSNYPYAVFRKKAMELGAAHFLSKSSDFGRVADVVESILRPVE